MEAMGPLLEPRSEVDLSGASCQNAGAGGLLPKPIPKRSRILVALTAAGGGPVTGQRSATGTLDRLPDGPAIWAGR